MYCIINNIKLFLFRCYEVKKYQLTIDNKKKVYITVLVKKENKTCDSFCAHIDIERLMNVYLFAHVVFCLK